MYGIMSNRGRGYTTASLFLIISLSTAGALPGPRMVTGRTVLTHSITPVLSGAAALSVADLRRRIEFMVSLKMRNYAEMLDRVANGEIITPQEMLQRYYPLEADYNTVVGWLGAEGFIITKTDPNHLGVFVSGTVGQVQQALQVNFGRVTVANKTYSSALTAPSVPALIEPLIIGINGLQPHIQPHKNSHRVPVQSFRSTSRPGPFASASPQIRNRPPFLVNEILKAYNGNGLTVTGSGEKIAIVIDTFPDDSDLTSFWAFNGVNQDLSRIEKVEVVSGPLPPVTGEETLDVEWSSGIAESAKVRIYATKDFSFVNIDQAYQAILNDVPSQPELHQVSISLALEESLVLPSQLQTDSQYFASMAANGLTVFVSSGDSGSEQGGIPQVNYYASDPSVTAVGGTRLTLSRTLGVATSETVWHGSGGGISGFFARPLWQIGVGVPSGSTRLVPDVASAADPETGCLVILNGQQTQFGGTSWSAPVWAGFGALINQARAKAGLPPAGLLGPKIYPLLSTTAFRDITSGNNGAFSATVGYDLCTGIGVPNIAILAQALGGQPVAKPYGEIIEPPPGSTLTSSTVTFTWSPGTDATAYWLIIGDGRDIQSEDKAGSSNIFSSGETGAHSSVVSNLPTDGRNIYVRLWSKIGGVWFEPPQDYTYTAAAIAVLPPVISPPSGKYKKKAVVSMTCATPNATLLYTLDGSIPTTNSILYQSPFAITKKRGTTTVRATAFKAGAPDSPSVAATYTITRKRRR
jgi:kumamolisin